MSARVTRLRVTLPGRTVGHLEHHRDGRVVWTPDEAWAKENVPRLSAHVPLRSTLVEAGGTMPAWFENLLPEYDPHAPKKLRQYLCARLGIRETQSFRLLAALGHDLPGGVEARPVDTSDSGPELEAPSATDDRLRFSSVAGMQLKFSMSLVRSGFVLGATKGARQYLVKLPGAFSGSGGEASLVEVERATMAWTRASGLEVPAHEIVSTKLLSGIDPGWVPEDGTAFAIERFDRSPSGTKLHVEDLCQALGLAPRHKYGVLERGTFGAGSLVAFVADQAGDEEAREATRRLGFVLASGNNDAHLKNWAFVWPAGAPRPKLSPCYDQVATVAWREHFGWALAGGPTLPLAFGSTHRFRLLDDEAVAHAAKAARASWFRDELLEGITRARSAYASVGSVVPAPMHEGLVEHWASTPLLAKLGDLRR
ncbi:MAG: HipA domain-containing protein [Myxococcales bacterium]|nr:HipA domain-containing protein [Myxococcales bacterium]